MQNVSILWKLLSSRIKEKLEMKKIKILMIGERYNISQHFHLLRQKYDNNEIVNKIPSIIYTTSQLTHYGSKFRICESYTLWKTYEKLVILI